MTGSALSPSSPPRVRIRLPTSTKEDDRCYAGQRIATPITHPVTTQVPKEIHRSSQRVTFFEGKKKIFLEISFAIRPTRSTYIHKVHDDGQVPTAYMYLNHSDSTPENRAATRTPRCTYSTHMYLPVPATYPLPPLAESATAGRLLSSTSTIVCS